MNRDQAAGSFNRCAMGQHIFWKTSVYNIGISANPSVTKVTSMREEAKQIICRKILRHSDSTHETILFTEVNKNFTVRNFLPEKDQVNYPGKL